MLVHQLPQSTCQGRASLLPSNSIYKCLDKDIMHICGSVNAFHAKSRTGFLLILPLQKKTYSGLFSCVTGPFSCDKTQT